MRRSWLALLIVAAPLGLAIAGDDLAKRLADAIKAKDPAAIEVACDELAKADDKEAVLALVSQVSKVEGRSYWTVVAAAASFKSKPALDELGKQIIALQSRTPSPSSDLLFALQNNTAPEVVTPLALVLEKGKYELQLMAANQLALVRSPASVEALVQAWRREEATDAELARRLQGAVLSLTQKSFDDAKSAEAWWRDHKSDALPDDKPPEKPRDREFKTVEKAPSGRIVVLSADRNALDGDDRFDNDFDKIQTILEHREIPHTVVFKYDFEKDPEKYLKDASALLVNCNQIQSYCACPQCAAHQVKKAEQESRFVVGCDPNCTVHVMVDHRLSAKTLAAIKKWVENEGGYLYTEDWGILEVLETLWPDKVGSGTREVKAGKITDKPILIRGYDRATKAVMPRFAVSVTPVRGTTSHPLMRGVWQVAEATTTALPERTWEVDDESPAIEVKDRKDVIVLFESATLAPLAKGNTVVAITFRPGSKFKAGTEPSKATGEWVLARSGRVLHTLSHFGKQQGTEDGEALENMLVNFLLEAGRRKDAH